MENSDLIFALITAPGAGAVAVIRVSGTGIREALHPLFHQPERVFEHSHRVVYAKLRDPDSGEILDDALVTYFAGPNSFTGEDVVEFSLHGSPYIVRRFQEILGSLSVRGARPGEFTERAFHNGKVDLAQAEAVADLIAAETESQARVAREQLEGRLSGAISELGEPLRDLLAEIEAGIDFPEEDINPEESSRWFEVIRGVRARLAELIESYRTGRIYRDGAQVVLAGLPNAGKSSLLNRIVGDERAIVTAIAGTTRDSIEERIVLEGLYLKLWDTAGLAQEGYKPDPVERIGIEHSWKRIRQADLVLYVVDAASEAHKQFALIREVSSKAQRILLVANKADLALGFGFKSDEGQLVTRIDGVPVIGVSATTGQGIAELKSRVIGELVNRDQGASDSVLICTERHRNALVEADDLLREASSLVSNNQPGELVAQQVRAALHSLNDIIGVTSVDEILGRIFSKFCIGK